MLQKVRYLDMLQKVTCTCSKKLGTWTCSKNLPEHAPKSYLYMFHEVIWTCSRSDLDMLQEVTGYLDMFQEVTWT
jgi:hypothetical protein